MITVHIRESGDFRELEATGHALYAPEGQDIVCSAFSILIYTLVDFLLKDEKVSIYKNKIEPGNICIGFNAENTSALTAFNTVVGGIKLLAESYPENIVIHGNFPEDI